MAVGEQRADDPAGDSGAADDSKRGAEVELEPVVDLAGVAVERDDLALVLPTPGRAELGDLQEPEVGPRSARQRSS